MYMVKRMEVIVFYQANLFWGENVYLVVHVKNKRERGEERTKPNALKSSFKYQLQTDLGCLTKGGPCSPCICSIWV